MKKFLLFFLVLPFCGVAQNNYISNKDYKEFVTYVRDSLFRVTMGEEVDEEAYLISSWDENYKTRKIIGVNWKTKLDVNSPEAREALEPWYYKPEERLNRKREINTRKLIHNKVKIYPNTLVWFRDSTLNKSWATFLAKNYFVHPYFEDYPVYGISVEQLTQYLKWKYPNNQKRANTTNSKRIILNLSKSSLKLSLNDYSNFYLYTRDSIVRMILCHELDEEKYCQSINKYLEDIKPPIVKWKHKIKWNYEDVSTTLKDNKLVTSDNKIDNRRIMFVYSNLNYFRASILPDTIDRSTYFTWKSINLCANKYIPEFSPINIKSNHKNNEPINLQDIDIHQLIAYYHWKKDNYNGKDVFENFIPLENDVESLRTGELPDSFYNFSYTIPVITIE